MTAHPALSSVNAAKEGEREEDRVIKANMALEIDLWKGAIFESSQ